MNNFIQEFVVKRSGWVRGNIGGYSSLLNDQHNKCCLGFLALACGAEKEDIRDKSYWGLVPKLKKHPIYSFLVESDRFPGSFPGSFYGKETYLGKAIVSINDDSEITESDREAKLTELFAEMNIKVIFED